MYSTSDYLQLAAGITEFSAYIPLTIAIVRGEARQSFAAFFLWGLLDTVAAVSAMLVHGNFWLATTNAAGTFFIASLLIYKKQFFWSRTETFTCVLVALCVGVWHLAGHTAAIVASSVAVVIAGLPQMAHTRREPNGTPVAVYLTWLAANIISFFGGRDWSIDERFYATCGMILCLSILIIAWVPAFQVHGRGSRRDAQEE